MEIIARNQFKGTVSAINRGETHALVTVDADLVELNALITTHELDKLGLNVGTPVVAGVRSTDVMIGVEKDHVPITANNQFKGHIVEVERGDVTTQATFRFDLDEGKELLAVMPNPAADRTEVVKGGHVFAVIKAVDVTLAVA